MIVVFDTCTKPEYYEDLHKVLASPRGTIIRYDYEQRLFTDAACNTIKEMQPEESIEALLIYGQFRDYEKGDPDPERMLSWDEAIFIPTRRARIVNHAILPHTNPLRQNINFHLELLDFINPNTKAVEGLVKDLEERCELPFGKEHAYKWVAETKLEADTSELLDGSDDNWGAVVDEFGKPPSQFFGDVFWRILSVSRGQGKNSALIKPSRRKSNKFGDPQAFHSDYLLRDDQEYFIYLRNHVAVSEENPLPKAYVRIFENEPNLLELSAEKIELERNRTQELRAGVPAIDYIGSKNTVIKLTTEQADSSDVFPIGSSVELTLKVAKRPLKLVLSASAGLIASVSLILGGKQLYNDPSLSVYPVVLIGLGLGMSVAAKWLLTGRLKPGG